MVRTRRPSRCRIMTDPSATYTAVDLSRLPAPAIIETLSFDAVYADMLASFLLLMPDFDATVESDPVIKILQLCAYRELLLRGRVNDAAKAVMLAYAVGTDLDHAAALFGVARLLITPADPDHGIAAVYEGDDDFRRRVSLAPEAFSVAGPQGAYIFHALSADGDVRDASADSPVAGDVVVTVLSRIGNGAADGDLLATVAAHVSPENVRPLTDHVIVRSAEIINFAVQALISTFSGPDHALVIAAGQAKLVEFLETNRKLGRDVTRAGIIASLFVEGVQNIELTSPPDDVPISDHQAGWCTGITLDWDA
jgi:phage-related baseplate assembly protein